MRDHNGSTIGLTVANHQANWKSRQLSKKKWGGALSADVVIVGGGSGGIAAAASLGRRNPELDLLVIEPRGCHDYQPGWTLVGAGLLDRKVTRRAQAGVIPKRVRWHRAAAQSFRPDTNQVLLTDGSIVAYRALIIAVGLTLDWQAIQGLTDTLGQNGVTSNYSFETAPYTWDLVRSVKEGVALFTQPPMPIKCAGAPQKAMYLACDYWRRGGTLAGIDVTFHTASSVLFGVPEYVPALMPYVERYGINLKFESALVAVDGPGGSATFLENGRQVTKSFDLLHVTPPQKAPRCVAESELADAGGYVHVDPATLCHVRYDNIFAIGDATSTPNAKTMAAARKQAPVVAANVVARLSGKAPCASYDGYGSCPLTVERGRIVLAEFGYANKLLPTFPKWLIDGTKPQRRSWLLKLYALPALYWHGMLKAREWLARPLTLGPT